MKRAAPRRKKSRTHSQTYLPNHYNFSPRAVQRTVQTGITYYPLVSSMPWSGSDHEPSTEWTSHNSPPRLRYIISIDPKRASQPIAAANPTHYQPPGFLSCLQAARARHLIYWKKAMCHKTMRNLDLADLRTERHPEKRDPRAICVPL